MVNRTTLSGIEKQEAMRKMLIQRPAHLSFIGLATVTLTLAAIVAALIAAAPYTPHFVRIPLPKKPIFSANVPDSLVDQRARIENEFAEARRARTDMLVYAIEHGMAVEAEHTFCAVADFDDAWHLYSTNILTPEGKVTLYTAVYKKEPLIRYIAAWDVMHGRATPWQPVLW